MNIKEVYRVNYMKDRWSYVGLLRNEKRFNIHDDVFISYEEKIIKCTVVGVELPPEDNPEYIYKIKIPDDIIRIQMESDDFYSGKNFDKIEMICDRIFSSPEEAKKSAVENLERMYKLQKEEIDSHFDNYIEL